VSAAQWRKAMNAGATAQAWPRRERAAPASAASATTPVERLPDYTTPTAPAWLAWIGQHVSARHVLVMLLVLVYPWVATPFFNYQIAAQSLALGLIALSLTFLAGYGGMISLAQMTVAGIASYMVAIFGVSGTAEISLGWPWWVVVPLALVIATACATFIGWLSVRTEGIYTIMITLAIGVAFHYLALQNYSVFNGFQGLQKVYAPTVGGVNWGHPIPFYYLTLFWALAGYFFVKYLIRTPFGIALQGIRDNPRRMNALGFNVIAHRVAAYAVAGLIAAIGGVLFVWYNGLVTPGSVGTSWLINILVIAMLGGMRHPIGAFLGAIVFVLLQNFAIDYVFDRERFNLVIGGVFLAIVLFSPDGLLGLWARARARLGAGGAQSRITSNPRPSSRLAKGGR
jgi:branched-chain amino acid transport system permease protein